MQTAVPLLGCFLIIILQCVQADVYVKANSTCGSSCDGSVTNPWPTIAQGIQAVYSVGGTVIMNPGIYTGPGNFDLIITNSAAVVLEYVCLGHPPKGSNIFSDPRRVTQQMWS